MECMDVITWAKLFHTSEQKINRIIITHVFPKYIKLISALNKPTPLVIDDADKR